MVSRPWRSKQLKKAVEWGGDTKSKYRNMNKQWGKFTFRSATILHLHSSGWWSAQIPTVLLTYCNMGCDLLVWVEVKKDRQGFLLTRNSLPFYISEAWNGYPFGMEPSRIDHYKEFYPPPWGLSIKTPCWCLFLFLLIPYLGLSRLHWVLFRHFRKNRALFPALLST